MEITGNPSLAKLLADYDRVKSIPPDVRRVFNDTACKTERLLVISGAATILSAGGSAIAFAMGSPLAALGGVCLTALFGGAARFAKKGYDTVVGHITNAVTGRPAP